jgi:hypothetical protein
MNVRSVRAALLAASLLLLAQGAHLSQPNTLPDPRADLAATARATEDDTYSLVAAQAAARSISVWQLLCAQR